MTRKDWSRLAVTSALGIALSSTFVFLAALPIRYLRLTFGRKLFLTSSLLSAGLLASAGFWEWSIIHASICLLIGSYREMEENKFSIFSASVLAIGITTLANVIGFLSYTSYLKISPKALLISSSEPIMAQLQQLPQFQETAFNKVLWYLPSAITITMMLVLFVSLTVSRFATSKQLRLEMRMFSLPDWAIWVFIGSLAATFIDIKQDWLPLVSMNFLAVVMAGYFFQGLAVFNHFLDRFSIFGFWRLLAYFLIFFQVFILIIGLGILDYWFDFRVQGLSGSNNQNLKKFKRSTK